MKNFSNIVDNFDVTTKKYVDDGLAEKANLSGGNTFSGEQFIENGSIGDPMGFCCFNYTNPNNPELNVSDTARVYLDNGYGTAGQVFTSQGENAPPIWADVSGGGGDNSKHGYTQLTNENLNTITEVGWYRAASGNTCSNRPSAITSTIPFVLLVEKSTDDYIKQTIYRTGGNSSVCYQTYVRYSSNTGSSWATWVQQQTLADGYAQSFSGRKVFTGGINLSNSPLLFSGSTGSSSQFAMSQGGAYSPKWVNLQVKVNGTAYTADSSGLVDLGEISGGTSTSQYNDIY